MERNRQKGFILGGGLLAAFILWTILIQRVDVQPAGVNGTSVGFAAVNTWFHHLTGVHMAIYTITDWLGLVPIAFVPASGFSAFCSGFTEKASQRWTGTFCCWVCTTSWLSWVI